MNHRRTIDELVEELATLEHEQWMHWSQAVAAKVPAVTRERWRQCWVNYAELPDEMKEFDRTWARKVAALLRERNWIQPL